MKNPCMFRNLKVSWHYLTTCKYIHHTLQESWWVHKSVQLHLLCCHLVCYKKEKIMSIKNMLSVLRKVCVKHQANINLKNGDYYLVLSFVLFWIKKEEITERWKPDRASKTKPGSPFSSRSGTTTGSFTIFSFKFL